MLHRCLQRAICGYVGPLKGLYDAIQGPSQAIALPAKGLIHKIIFDAFDLSSTNVCKHWGLTIDLRVAVGLGRSGRLEGIIMLEWQV